MISIPTANAILIPICIVGICYAALNAYLVSRVKLTSDGYMKIDEETGTKKINLMCQISEYISKV